MKKGNFDQKQTLLLHQLTALKIPPFEGYDLGRLLFNVSGQAIRFSWFQVIKSFLQTMLFVTEEIGLKKNDRDNKVLLISYDYRRKDHTSYWNRFKEIAYKFDELAVRDVSIKERRVKSIKEIFSIFRIYFRIRKEMHSIENKKYEIFLALNLTQLVCIKNSVEKLDLNYRAAFIFFDGNKIENLIVQNIRKRGVTVATMQHGQPVFHGLDKDRINQTMILNFSSDFIMVTGEFSKKQFMLGGVPEKNIFVGGSLRTLSPTRSHKDNNFVVFLDCPTIPGALKNNIDLIEWAEKLSEFLDSVYIVKCHPQDNPLRYKTYSLKRGSFSKANIDIDKILQNKSFGLLHASGVYLDIISNGVKAFCFVNDMDFPLVEDGLDSFKDMDDLKEKIQEWNGYDFEKKKTYMETVIRYYLNPKNVESRYTEFIKQLSRDAN